MYDQHQSMLPPEGADPRQLVKVMQIVCGALMLGVILFAVVTLVLHFGRAEKPQADFPLLAYMGLGFAAMAFAAQLIVVPAVTSSALKQIRTMRPVEELKSVDLYGVYQTKMIVGCALLEGAAFLNLISVISHGQLWPLGVVAALLAVMAVSFPTYERVDGWAGEQLRLMQLESAR